MQSSFLTLWIVCSRLLLKRSSATPKKWGGGDLHSPVPSPPVKIWQKMCYGEISGISSEKKTLVSKPPKTRVFFPLKVTKTPKNFRAFGAEWILMYLHSVYTHKYLFLSLLAPQAIFLAFARHFGAICSKKR